MLELDIFRSLDDGSVTGTIECRSATFGELVYRYIEFDFINYYVYWCPNLAEPAQIRNRTESRGLTTKYHNDSVLKHAVVVGMQVGTHFQTHTRNVKKSWVDKTRKGLVALDAHKITSEQFSKI